MRKLSWEKLEHVLKVEILADRAGTTYGVRRDEICKITRQLVVEDTIVTCIRTLAVLVLANRTGIFYHTMRIIFFTSALAGSFFCYKSNQPTAHYDVLRNLLYNGDDISVQRVSLSH